MISQVATILGTISFFIQNVLEFIKPLLEKYIPGFNFSDIKIIQKKITLLDKIYANTLHSTTAQDIKVIDDGNDFTFSDHVGDLIKVRTNLSKKIRSKQKAKSRRYMLLGITLGIIACLVVSKVTGVSYFNLADNYTKIQASTAFWIFDSVMAGILVGFGSKPVNDVLSYFNGSPKSKTA